ncbi:plasma-membrane proton-efflux P-type ATPase [Cyanobium sp. LEGE 06113]|uniref:plasma-membrane proton-efflux P-type ATPase n=1 Tax=Cyanobium sp. LEGE 06113 TaxID=1297573 RepID=UPI001882458E|nr:plasma-membrane proton-efflux P-type ATPase [Cyanobium sp. LEGE 06113]MBE9154015.1 plasma-membrane proton-efflux P-type ATPase [Cyanobium sp. LEGE 06113]
MSDPVAPALPALFERLHSDGQGLSSREAGERLQSFGPNALQERSSSRLQILLSYLWGPMPWMIEVAILLCALVGDWVDFLIISALLLGNTAIAYLEETSAGDAVAALKAQLALESLAKRDGCWTSIPASQVVPGDRLRIALGDVIPADMVLLTEDPIEVDQSALTGESLAVEHRSGELIYSGSILKRGRAEGIVAATGANTFFGKTATLVSEATSTDHLQAAVLKLSDYLIVVNLVLVGTILVVRIQLGDDWLRVLKYCLVLTVASIPLATPTVLAVTMAIGAQAMARKGALVTQLGAIDELASVDMLCSDKTGTLTLNQLSLGDPFTLDGISPAQLLLAAGLASEQQEGDAIDQTILNALGANQDLARYQRGHFTPFDPVSKRTEVAVTDPQGRKLRFSKGAPQAILALVEEPQAIQETVEDRIKELAGKGLRALGVGQAVGDGPWQMLGILSLFDPPRPDSAHTIAAAEQLGVPLKMVTGDQVLIARETCRQLGLRDNVLDASLFRHTPATQLGQLGQQITAADGFAQVYPEDKFHIVESLQKSGFVVAMTGDGVNDAPALKQADAGIAVSGATDAARAAASIVLTTPGLSVIVDAIQLSRKIFLRMNSYCLYRVVETVRILIFTTAAILWLNDYPVTVVMLILLAVINDGSMVTIAYDNTLTPALPQRWNMPYLILVASAIGLVGVVETFLLYLFTAQQLGLPLSTVHTLVYLHLAVGGMMTIYATRVQGPFWSIKPSARMLWATGASVAVSTLLARFGWLMAPIDWAWIAASWGYAFVWFLVFDAVKLGLYRLIDPSHFVMHGAGYLRRWRGLSPSP